MGEIFWKSVRKARREHFCDRCLEQIYPGEAYARWIWAPRDAHRYFVMKEHYDPSCRPAEEPGREETPVYETIEARVAIVLVAEVRQVLKVGIDGKVIIESETHFVPRLLTEEESIETSDSGDDDVPF